MASDPNIGTPSEHEGSGVQGLPQAASYAFPMSFAQQRLWFLEQFEPGNTLYNIVWPLRFIGRLDIGALERSLNEIVRRHEVLRASFRTIDDEPVQVIAPAVTIPIVRRDLTPLTREEREEEIQRLANAEADTPLDLARGPLVRVLLADIDHDEHVLILTLHHIVFDRWSRGIFFRELSTLYTAYCQGQAHALPELPIQYTDFAVWQRENLSGKRLEKQLSYWKQQLAGAPQSLDLPTDRPRPALQSFRGDVYSFEFSGPLAQTLAAFSRQEGVTLFMLLLAGFKALLGRYSGASDILVGTPVANRQRAELENLIGFFANTLVLRTNLSGNPTFRELLSRVRNVALEAYDHQDLPFEKLVEELNPERSLSHSPLFQVLLALQNAPREGLQLPGLRFESIPIRATGSKFDLALFINETAHGFEGRLEYSTDLFERQTIARMMGHLENFLSDAVSQPERRISELEFLSQSERREILVDWNQTATDYPEVSLAELFEQQAAKSPQAVAVRFGDEFLTYSELDRRSNQLAHYLQSHGVRSQSLVGLYLDRSLEMMVALLGVLKSGAAYVPLDPAFPSERIRFIVEDSGVQTVITQQALATSLPPGPQQIIRIDSEWARIAASPGTRLSVGAEPNGLAYVLYTSGSTGKPKGVEIEHRALVNFLTSMRREPGLSEGDILLAVTTLSFDIAGLELYLPLVCGGQAVVASREQASDGRQLLALLERSQASIMQATPATWRLLIEAGWQGSPKLKVLCGGEALPRLLAEQLLTRCRELWNMYGPTETTIWSSVYRVEQGKWSNAPLGRPIANTQMYVLDENRRPVPPGVSGELHIGGDGLARGYHRRPELTAEKFLANPFLPGTRFYRTGDVARFRSDGVLEYLGRTDHQVKVRGFRIELGEIESSLANHEAVEQAVVVAREDTAGDKRLVAYILPVEGKSFSVDEVRSHLRQSLPEYMVPSRFVVVDRFPLTPNGKIDRRALPAPDQLAEAEAKPQVPARDGIEEVVSAIWSDVLGTSNIGVHDNFFELGGHSLLATRVLSRLRQMLRVELPLRTIFEHPTLAELAEQVRSARHSQEGLEMPALVPVARGDKPPLSFAQQRLWFLDQLEPDNALFNIAWAFRLRGPLDMAALRASFQELVRRHEILRTSFSTQGDQPVQVITPHMVIDLPFSDLSSSPQAEEEAWRRMREEGSRPFDLSRGPLIRASLVRVAPEDHFLSVNIHHIVSDRWSMGVLTRELMRLYEAYRQGKPSPLDELPLQYADYAVWQRQWLEGEVLERQLEYWKKQLAGAPQVLEIPTDRPRPPKESFRGDIKGVPLSASLTEKLKALSRQEGTTLFMTLLSAWNALLARYSGQEDIVVGTPIANRNRSEIEGLIGFFANTLVLRSDLSGNPSFRQLLRRVRETALGAYSHQDLPFEKLVEELRPERSLSHNPLFQVLFALQNTPGLEQEIPGLKLEAYGAKVGTAKCDLALFMGETASGLVGRLEYNTDIFEASTINRLVTHFQNLIEAIVADPDQAIGELALLSSSERQQILVDWNATGAEYPRDLCLHQLFERQAERTPDRLAVSFEGQSLSYRELNQESNRLARYLAQRGIGPGSLVGVYLERSLEMMVTLMAVEKAGAAYVPIDPAYPAERIAFMLEDARPAVLVTEESLAGALRQAAGEVVCLGRDRGLWQGESAANLSTAVSAEDLVYVIFTSGSTGRPKGVEIRHRAVVNLLTAMAGILKLTEDDVLVALASFAFDMSIPELYLPLIAGGRVVVGRRELAADGEALAHLLNQTGATIIHATPTTWRLLLDAGFTGTGLKRVVGAEPLPKELLVRLLEVDASLYNFYGPTETTVWSTFHEFRSKDEVLTVGRPLANTEVYILDHERRPVPVGIRGELYIGGDGIAAGYLGRPELTREKFVSHPFSSKAESKLYRTGDLARYLADGRIDFLGRMDNQVKLRGYRIELGEIEAALGSHPAVDEAIVVVREERPGDKRLVGYIVVKAGQFASASELRTLVKAQLPDYMVPSVFVFREALPLNANGKVDRKALETMPLDKIEVDTTSVVPRTPVEEAVAEIWAGVLGMETIGAHDDFFSLGGHSLLATQVVSRIRQVFSVEMPLRAIFESPTVASLAHQIEQEKQKQAGLHIPELVPQSRSSELPVSLAQQRLIILELLGGTGAAYNIPMAFRITGALDPSVLERSLNEILKRHEALRTVLRISGDKALQVIMPAAPLVLDITDLSALEANEGERCASHVASEEARRSFDLERGPLYRFRLLRLSAQEHVFVATVHHVVFDGWSIGVFLNELATAYRCLSAGRPAELPELPIQYADFAIWQRNYLKGEVLEKQLSYWKRQLLGAPPSLDLPTDRPRPALQTFVGAQESLLLPRPLLSKLQQLSQSQGTTLFMTLLAGLDVLLARYSGQEDIVVGSPIAGRGRAELERLLGLFVNTLVLRTDLSGNPSFEELLRRVRETALGAYSYQDLPFERLVEELRPERDLSRNPVFQVMFILHNQPRSVKEIPGLLFSPFKKEFGAAMFDLTVIAQEAEDGLRTTFNYNRDLFDRSTIARMLAHWRRLLEAVVENPRVALSELELLSPPERQHLLIELNETQSPYPELAVHELFEEQARKTPRRVAVCFGDQSWTYSELNKRANRVANYLLHQGVMRESLIGIYMERSLDMMAALLGVWKAGCAYVPLDPAYPKERIAFIAEDAHLSLLLTQGDLVEPTSEKTRVVHLDRDGPAIARERSDNPGRETRPEDLAYVLYTSGSTGKPKGVQIEHRNVVNFLRSMIEEPGISADDVLLAVTTLSFDIAGLELYLPLLVGARVQLASRQQASAPDELQTLLQRSGATVMQGTPATWRLLLAGGWQEDPKLKVLCGGEALPRELAEQLLPRCAALWNLYGPTETTIWSSVYRVNHCHWSLAPIGRPIANTQMYVLDQYQKPVPTGVPGELYIGGAGVARGYLNRPQLTAERFIADPYADSEGRRLYRTGDRVRYGEDGNLVYLGRCDSQIKLRGFRIELGEIESVLSESPIVRHAAVIVREDQPGNQQLVGYLVFQADAADPKDEKTRELVLSELKQFVRRKLPEYMVPSAFMVLERLPLTPNGKIDRRALPAPERHLSGELIRPRNELEQKILEIWQTLLGITNIGIQNNFFELGGHSLLAVRMLADIRSMTGKEIPVARLFQGATIEGLAAALREAQPSDKDLVVQLQPGKDKPPLFLIVVPGMNALGYAALAQYLSKDQPVYKIQGPGPRLRGRPYTLAEYDQMAEEYVRAMKTVQPDGPYYLGGMCEGARIAFDMARLLEAGHEQVPLLAIFDTWVVENTQIRPLWMLDYYLKRLGAFWRLPFAKKQEMFINALRRRAVHAHHDNGRGGASEPGIRWKDVYWPGKDFRPPTFGGTITLFKIPKQAYYYVRDPMMGWGTRTTAKVEIHEIEFKTKRHVLLFRAPYVLQLARKLTTCLERTQGKTLKRMTMPSPPQPAALVASEKTS